MKRTYAVLNIFNAIKKLVNTLTPQSVTHTNYIHLPIPPWLMRGVVTFKMLGSIMSF